MNNKNKSIEAIIAPPAPHMVGDGFAYMVFSRANTLTKKE